MLGVISSVFLDINAINAEVAKARRRRENNTGYYAVGVITKKPLRLCAFATSALQAPMSLQSSTVFQADLAFLGCALTTLFEHQILRV